MLRTYKIYNSTVRFLKYEFNNKLLDGITLFRVTLYITWTQYIYIYNDGIFKIILKKKKKRLEAFGKISSCSNKEKDMYYLKK